MNLHVVEGKSIKSGVDAFICIWSELRYFKLLGLLVRLPVIYQLACIFYRLFANYRFKNLSHCQVVDKQK
jgi:predicted DCC family thiol-disulfide oxidoreductase YuxK